jgi:hypothetical protein
VHAIHKKAIANNSRSRDVRESNYFFNDEKSAIAAAPTSVWVLELYMYRLYIHEEKKSDACVRGRFSFRIFPHAKKNYVGTLASLGTINVCRS